MNQTICILYGINEGPAMGERLVAACRQAGLTVVDDPTNADILFAHSGGCLLLPTQRQAQLIVLTGVPFYPGRLWLACTIQKVWREWRLYRQQGRLSEWGSKWLNHIRYSANLRDGLRMAANHSISKQWNGREHQVIIRNHYDVYCTPNIAALPFKGPRTFVSLQGEHDDCWDNPEPYVNLLQSLYTHE